MKQNAILLAIIGLALALIIWYAVAHRTAPILSDVALITSGSMEPTLHEGQSYKVILPADAPFAAIKAGDIIRFEATWTAGPVAHRAFRKTLDGWVTKGDANPLEDPGAVNDQNYLGTVQP